MDKEDNIFLILANVWLAAFSLRIEIDFRLFFIMFFFYLISGILFRWSKK